MPIEHKAQRPSSRLLAHLNWLLDEALEQTFPASDPVAIDIDRESHDREARVFIAAHGAVDGIRHRNHCSNSARRNAQGEMRIVGEGGNGCDLVSTFAVAISREHQHDEIGIFPFLE